MKISKKTNSWMASGWTNLIYETGNWALVSDHKELGKEGIVEYALFHRHGDKDKIRRGSRRYLGDRNYPECCNCGEDIPPEIELLWKLEIVPNEEEG